MKLVGVAGPRSGLASDPVDRLRVERSEIIGRRGLERATRVHGTSPSLFERCVVQERVGARVQDLVSERRGLRGVPRDEP